MNLDDLRKEASFVDYANVIEEIPQEHDISLLTFKPAERQDALTIDKAEAVIWLITNMAPRLGVMCLRWGLESTNGETFMANGAARQLLAEQGALDVALNFKADFWIPARKWGNRVGLGQAWRQIVNGAAADPTRRLTKALQNIAGMDRATGQDRLSDAEAADLIDRVRLAGINAAAELIQAMMDSATRIRRDNKIGA